MLSLINAQYLQVFFTDFRIVVVLIIQISKYIFTKVLRTLITFFLKEIIEKNKWKKKNNSGRQLLQILKKYKLKWNCFDFVENDLWNIVFNKKDLLLKVDLKFC